MQFLTLLDDTTLLQIIIDARKCTFRPVALTGKPCLVEESFPLKPTLTPGCFRIKAADGSRQSLCAFLGTGFRIINLFDYICTNGFKLFRRDITADVSVLNILLKGLKTLRRKASFSSCLTEMSPGNFATN